MKSFQDKVVIVSGASSGIGEAAALELRREGATVYGLARTATTMDAARDRHPSIRWLAAEVSDRAQVDAAVAAVLDESGRLDLLVNNAGIYAFAPLEGSTEELVRRHFDVNVFGLTFLTQAALPALRASRGAILNVSSTAGHKGMAGQSIYAASKAAVESLTRSWALELAPHGVRVNAIAPGPTATPGVENLPIPPELRPVVLEQLLAQVPLRRMGTSEEVARWIIALADPSATWMTGHVLAIDGGMSL